MLVLRTISSSLLSRRILGCRPTILFPKSLCSRPSKGSKLTITPSSETKDLFQINKSIESTLAKEIKEEESIQQAIEAPPGWEYKITSNIVTLSKKVEFESVVVSFDALNTSKIPYTDQQDPIEDTDDPTQVLPQFACIPELKCKISREGKGKIEFRLNYVEDDDFDEGPYNDEDDADDEPFDEESDKFKPRTYDDEHPLSFKVKNNMWVDIQSVTYFDQEGKIVYTFTNDMFDYEFGCNIIEFLNIRGVDFEFLNSVMDLAGKVDSKLYLKFLHGFKDYITN